MRGQEVSCIHPRETITYYSYWYEKKLFKGEKLVLPDDVGGFLFYKLGETGGPLENADSIKKMMDVCTDLFYGDYDRFLFYVVVKDIENEAMNIVQHYDSILPEHPGPIVGVITKYGSGADEYVFSSKGVGLIFIKESDMKLFKNSVPRTNPSVLDLGAKIVTVNKLNEAGFYSTITDCAKDAGKARKSN